MLKLVFLPVVLMVLVGCGKTNNEDASKIQNEVVSKEQVINENKNVSEVEAQGESNYQSYTDLLEDFSKKETGRLSDGDYQNITLINKRPIEMTITIKDGRMKKATEILSSNEVFTATANYKRMGSTLTYTNIEGNKFLFNPQGEAYVSLENNNFALVDICEPELSKKIPSVDEAKQSDTFCKDGILFTAFRATETKALPESD